MSETPIGDAVEAEQGELGVDDGTDDVAETAAAQVEPELGAAPEVEDIGDESDGSTEDPEDADPGEPEDDEAPVVMTSPYAIPGEGNQGGNE